MNEKRCIVHIPNSIDSRALSGSQIRPLRMIQGFRENDYLVDVVMGSGKERKSQIKKIKENIENGITYDFVYSESSTMPTLLTEKDHLPRYPFLDFGFFKYCRKKGMKIGLFYRDVQWKFPFYKESVSKAKRMVSIPMYRYDLYKYKKNLDVFYLPTERMKNYLQECPELLRRAKILMPGCESVQWMAEMSPRSDEKLRIFYVGGIVGIYDISVFLEAVSKVNDVEAIICCREPEWNQVKEDYQHYLGQNIQIVHASGKDLEPYYEWADVCSVFGGNGEYFSMAMPVKVFEYLSKNKPMLGIRGSVSGDMIEKKNIGWASEYSTDALTRCLEHILEHPYEIKEKKQHAKVFYEESTWKMRAKQVIQDLEK